MPSFLCGGATADNPLSFLRSQCVLNDKLGLLLNTSMYEPDNEAPCVFHLPRFICKAQLRAIKVAFYLTAF